jgi:hypothetical protein
LPYATSMPAEKGLTPAESIQSIRTESSVMVSQHPAVDRVE